LDKASEDDTKFPFSKDTAASTHLLNVVNIGSLMLADHDLLVLSESKEGPQESLNKLLTYCNKWQLVKLLFIFRDD
jgi:hypothetical protein